MLLKIQAQLTSITDEVTSVKTDVGTINTHLERVEKQPAGSWTIQPRRFFIPPEATNLNQHEDALLPDRQEHQDPLAYQNNQRRDQYLNRIHDPPPHPDQVKLTPPTFAGNVDHDANLEWERRMEHIFAYYGYTEQKKCL